MGCLIGKLCRRFHVPLFGRLFGDEMDGSADSGFTAGRALGAARYLDAFNVEYGARVKTVGLVAKDTVDINRDREVLEEAGSADSSVAAYIDVAVRLHATAIAALTDLHAGYENLHIIDVLDTQFLYHVRVPAGDGHRPVDRPYFAALAGDDDLFDQPFVLVLVGLGRCGQAENRADCGQCRNGEP